MLGGAASPASVAGRQHGARARQRAVAVPDAGAVAEPVLHQPVLVRHLFDLCRLGLGRLRAHLE